MADNTLNISPFFKFEIKTPARGLNDYDPGALNANQQEELNKYKLNVIKENVIYLSRHIEFKRILICIAQNIWRARPRDVIGRVSKMFAMPEKEMKRVISEGTDFYRVDVNESEDEEWDY